MATTLLVVVASPGSRARRQPRRRRRRPTFYAAFLIVMAFAGRAVARLFHLDTGASRAVVFSGATRNSLVVLPGSVHEFRLWQRYVVGDRE